MINKKRLVSRFIKYVKVDSLSKKEAGFLRLIKKELSGMGIKSVEDRAGRHFGGDCGNLYAFIKGNAAHAPRMLFNAHIDTVMPGENIKPRIKKGKIVSDGTTVLGADNKAGVAVIMEALKTLKERKLPHGDIDVLFTVAEEISLMGSKFVNRKFLKADFGYVLDGGDTDKIINKAPSQDSIKIKITGRAAHAGVHPEQGVNAIQVASAAISKMKIGRIDRETTSNIGIISGGVATNIVPETVIIKGEARSHDAKKLKRQIAHMKNVLHKACARYGAKLQCNIEPSYRAFEVPMGHEALILAKRAAKNIGLKPKIKATGGGSDANIFSSYGLPCLILGVGADNVHTKNENISVNDLAAGAHLLLNIIKESLSC
ncbi:MAG: M20/M25/M40 family metallo-hydrolase [bacterium]